MAVLSQKDIIEIVRANIEIMEEIIETIDDTIYLKDKKNYDEEAVKDHMKFLYGDPDKPDSSGKPSGLISELVIANDCLTKLAKVKAVKPKAIKKSAEAIVNSINTIIGVVESMSDSSKLKNLDQILETFQNVTKIVDCMWETSKNICKLALIAPLLIMSVFIAIMSVVIVMLFVWVVVSLIQMIKAQITKEQLETFERLRQLCWHLIVIDLQMIILALLAPIAAFAAVIALLGMVVLALAVVGICYLLRFMVKMIRKVYDDLSIVAMFFIILILLLLGIALGLMVIGMIAMVVIELIGPIALFLVTTIVLVLILVALGFIMSKVQNQLFDALIGLGIIAEVMISLFIVAVLLMLIALMAEVIMNNIGNLIGFFVTFIVITVLLIAIGFALGMLVNGPQAAIIASAMVGLGIVIALLTELVIVATLLLVLSLFNLDVAKVTQTISDISAILLHLVAQMLLFAIPYLIAAEAIIMLNLGLLLAIIGELIIIATELLVLQLFSLDKDKLDENINTIVSTLYGLMGKLSILSFPGLIIMVSLVLANMSLLLGVIAELIIVATELRILQAFDFDKEKLNNNITTVTLSMALIVAELSPLVAPFMLLMLGLIIANMSLLILVVLEFCAVAAELRILQSLDLDKKKLKRNITTIFDSIDLLFERFGDRKRLNKLEDLADLAEDMLDELTEATDCIMDIVDDCLKKINDITLNKSGIKKNIKTIFSSIDLLFENFGNEKKLEQMEDLADVAEDMLDELAEATDCMMDVVALLEKMSQIKLKPNKIKKATTEVFNMVDVIQKQIEQRIPKDDNFLTGFFRKWEESSRSDELLDQLGRVGQVVTVINTICEALNSLQKIKLKRNKITKNLEMCWDLVGELETQINERIPAAEEGLLKGWFSNLKKKQKENQFLEHLGRVGEIVSVIYTICEALNSLQKIKIKRNKLFGNLDAVWTVIEDIEKKIEEYCAPASEPEGEKKWWQFWKKSSVEKKADKEKAYMKHLGRVSNLINIIKGITETLSMIQELELDRAQLTTHLDDIFGCIDHIEKWIDKKFAKVEVSWWDMMFGWGEASRELAAEQIRNKRIQEYYKKINGMVGSIKGMADTFVILKDIDLDAETVKTKVSEVLDIADHIQTVLDERLNKMADKLRAQYGWEWSKWNASQDDYERIATEWAAESMERSLEMIGPVGEIVTVIGDIVNVLNNLQDLTLSKSKILNMIEGTFNFIDNDLIPMLENIKNDDSTKTVVANAVEALESRADIFEELKTFMDHVKMLEELANVKISKSKLTDALTYLVDTIPTTIYEAALKSDEDKINKMVEHIQFANEIYGELKDLLNLGEKTKWYETGETPGLVKLVNSINEMKVDDKVGKALETLLSAIPATLIDAATKLNINESKVNKVGLMIGTIEDIQDVLKEFNVSNTQVDNQKKMTENYIKFLDKIDKVNPENLKTTVSLFEQMARITESIEGNFEGLAQTINEKIAPLLEELNKLLEEIPEKIGEKTGGSESSSDDSGSSSKDSKKEDKKEKKNEKDLGDVVSKLSSILSSVNAIKGLVD